MKDKLYDVIIIGAGQSGLACAYFLRRTKLNFLLLDAEKSCGGAWLHAWDSLTLFSPAQHSSLPGWMMPKSESRFPKREEVIEYLCKYQKRYDFPLEQSVKVDSVQREKKHFKLNTSAGTYNCRSLISATGTFNQPFIPDIPGRKIFIGKQLHSADYRRPDPFQGQKVLIVGEGNSGAQILAEVSKVGETVWATRKEPDFLPDDVDGKVLFDQASARYYAEKKGERLDMSKYNLGSIVMVPPVKDARDREVLHSKGSFERMTEEGVVWEHGKRESFDAIIWCTGFGYHTSHLDELLQTDARGKADTKETRAKNAPGLWLVGYGNWTGYASATLIGVGRTAKKTVKEIEDFLS